MSDHDKKLKEQLEFFDYIYPHISRTLDEVKRQCNLNFERIVIMQEERKQEKLMIEQYKGKIQRIEQLLIEHGLIKLLGRKES